MNKIRKKPISRLGYDFIDQHFVPEGLDEFYLRNEQHDNHLEYRKLTAHEIEVLVKNENTADDWTSIYVTEHFNPNLVKSCQFYGMVRIGALGNFFLEYHDLQLPVGLYSSTIVSCDIGNNVVINNVKYLAHYQIGNEAILVNINEMGTTNHAKFGNGILKEEEGEEVRTWLEICNENGGRQILPFNGMLPGDAYLWSKYRDDKALMQRFVEMTDARFDLRRGYYGSVGDRSIIKNCLILKDVKIGSDAYIKGGNKLKNLTINSSPLAPTQIGEGVELVNGIIGYGCRIFYGVKAVRFVMGVNSVLKYGARLINSYLGDNSTISCCEVLNSLIFPAHEQHHNNSFLTASTVYGQSNIAAGATIGSNHNSRANDGEITCGRGFWPGLCVSLKHNSTFASYTLLAKGDFPAELNVSLPFALVNNREDLGRLEVMPAYWMMYNMYALARNSGKYTKRDKRIVKHQVLEYSYLAPDTVDEMFSSLTKLEIATGKALVAVDKTNGKDYTEAELIVKGREALNHKTKNVSDLTIKLEGVENSKRDVVVLKAKEGYNAYKEMIHFYSISELVKFFQRYKIKSLGELHIRMSNAKRKVWINLGGQLVPQRSIHQLKKDIVDRKIHSWDEIHEEYKMLGIRYNDEKAEHAFVSLLQIHDMKSKDLTGEVWVSFLENAIKTSKKIAKLTAESRKKDYENPFKKITFDTQEEMDAVMGALDDNEFIKETKAATRTFTQSVNRIKELQLLKKEV